MTIHKEGYRIIPVVFLITAVLGICFWLVFPGFRLWHILVYLSLFLFFCWTLWFFRSPERTIVHDDSSILSPADGKVVVVEETTEEEFFHKPMLKVSIFMSPFNVHLNRNPVSGKILYYRYHPGRYLVAWHPKSSTLNERTSIAYEMATGKSLMVRQVAGLVARRIVCYNREQQWVSQGAEMGFIKFGSRLDVYMPTESRIRVQVGDKVKGGTDLIANI
ncbi:MAG: phosphatidylserine decarboxylase family protein [Bacteroidales bacterium]